MLGWILGCFGGAKKDHSHAPWPQPDAQKKKKKIIDDDSDRSIKSLLLLTLDNAPTTVNDPDKELESLSKQTDWEPEDTKEIKEQVSFLKACGAIVRTPVELRSQGRLYTDRNENCAPKVWNSWFAPCALPSAQLLADKEGRRMTQPISRMPTPCRECHHAMEAPIFRETSPDRSFSMHPLHRILEHDSTLNDMPCAALEKGTDTTLQDNIFKSGTLPPILEARLSAREETTSGSSFSISEGNSHASNETCSASMGFPKSNFCTLCDSKQLSGDFISCTESLEANGSTNRMPYQCTHGQTSQFSEGTHNGSCCVSQEGFSYDISSHLSSFDNQRTIIDLAPQQHESPLRSSEDMTDMSSHHYVQRTHGAYICPLMYDGNKENTSDDCCEVFSDTSLHVSKTEYNKDDSNKPMIMDSMENSDMHQRHWREHLCAITPKSLPKGFIETPIIRLRMKPFSSALMPVENLSLWKKLKQSTFIIQDENLEPVMEAKPRQSQEEVMNDAWCDENSSGTERRQTCKQERQNHCMPGSNVRVDSSLSHWLKPHSEDVSDSSSSAGVISPASLSRTRTPVGMTIQVLQSPSAFLTRGSVLHATRGDYSATALKQSQWNGTGIPNSTTKYKEDQKVNWHATPFEVRLERALDQEGIVLQKKLFGVAPE